MANLKTTLCGMELDSPYVLGSGPCGWDAESLAACSNAGCGAVVTKSISINGAKNTTRHMISNGLNSLLNNEGGSDLTMAQWRDYEIKKAKDLGVKCLIASINGYGSVEDTVMISKVAIEAGADALELVSHDYHAAGALVDMVKAVRKEVSKPIIVKVNANWDDTEEVARQVEEGGADGLTAIDSIGPTFRVDIATGRAAIGGYGYGYMTGAPILPIALRYVHEFAKSTKLDLIGLGGVTNAEAAMEMLMAGATHVGVCTVAITQGPDIFKKLCSGLNDLMDKYGYPDVKSVSGTTFRTEFPLPEITTENFRFDKEACVHCNRCVIGCPYRARSFDADGNMQVDPAVCRRCGLCFGLCPKKAISIVD